MAGKRNGEEEKQSEAEELEIPENSGETEIHTFLFTGVSPLLLHSPVALEQPNETGVGGPKKIPAPEEEAARYLYPSEDDQLVVPAMWARMTMIGRGGGASRRKIGKFTANALVQAGVFNVEQYCRLFHPETNEPITEYEIDISRAVIGRAGIRRARPLIKKWAPKVPLEIDTGFLTVQHVLDLLNISGKLSGWGDYRPSRKGVYGRFRVSLIE